MEKGEEMEVGTEDSILLPNPVGCSKLNKSPLSPSPQISSPLVPWDLRFYTPIEIYSNIDYLHLNLANLGFLV